MMANGLNDFNFTGHQITGNINNGLHQNNDRALNYNTISMCKAIARTHPHAIKCLEAIWNRLFKYGVEIIIDGEPAKLKQEILDHVNRHFIPFCREFMFCYYVIGIVPASIATLDTGEKVPVVMTDLGVVTVGLDPKKNRGKVFKFYKTASKKGNYMLTPKRDKRTHIFSGYGYDPELDGTVCSPVASVLPWVEFNNKMLSCAYRAEERNTQPEIYTEIVDPQLLGGDKAMGTDININMWYGDRDRASEDARFDRIQLNQTQFEVAQSLSNLYTERWNNEVGGKAMTMRQKSQVNRPRPMPINPLPVGQRVAASVPRPVSRGDFMEINYREEEIISSIFGVPRSLFNAESRTVGGVRANSEMLIESLMAWRKRLSEAMTVMFKCIYEEELCDMFEEEVKQKAKEKLDAKKESDEEKPNIKGTGKSKSNSSDEEMVVQEFMNIVKSTVDKKSVQVQLPVISYDDSEDIWIKFMRGVITYQEYVRFSKMKLGLPVMESDREILPPWGRDDGNYMYMQMVDSMTTRNGQQNIQMPGNNIQAQKSNQKDDKRRLPHTGESEDEQEDKQKQKRSKKAKDVKGTKNKEANV